MDELSLLELERATLRLSRQITVGPISARISGGFVGLLGPNGVGKTTLLRGVVGLSRLHSGNIHIDGQPVRYRRLPRGVGGVIEEPRFLDWLSCYENLRVARPDSSADDASAALTNWGLEHCAQRPAGEMSQGMRQRLGLARVELGSPSTILLDEPTNALDIVWQERLWEWIRANVASGSTVLVASHHLEGLVAGGVERLIVLGAGAVIADLPVDPAGRTPDGSDARAAAREAILRNP